MACVDIEEFTVQSVTTQKIDDVLVVLVDNPPVNALSWHVRQGLKDGFEQALRDDSVKAIVLRCAGSTFIAGADITEFGKPPQGPDFNAVLNMIEAAPKPVVAAIHGTALGGGLETALVCHYRIAVPSARLGVPEVKLGLLPGAGGTQRLPRLLAERRAAEAEAQATRSVSDAISQAGNQVCFKLVDVKCFSIWIILIQASGFGYKWCQFTS